MSQQKTIVITECDHDAFIEEQQVAQQAGVELKIEQSTPETLVQNCQGAEGILVQYANIDADVMDQLPDLKVISRYGVGFDSVDIEAATSRGIMVCNVPDYGTEAVSDHAIVLTFSVARGIPRLDRGVREGAFDLPAVRPLFQTTGRVFGVVGLGKIGQATARKARGLGYRVIGYDIAAQPGEEFGGVEAVTFSELLQRSQVISLHVPLSKDSRNLFDEEAFSMMRPDAIIINTARGGLINDEALVAALEDKRIAGAGIDCHNIEPLPADHPLTNFDNVVLTPHLAWYSEESYGELKRRTMQGAADAVAGVRPQNLVNPQVWDAANLRIRTDLVTA